MLPTSTGNIAKALAEFCKKEGADFLVVGARGFGPLRAYFLGSVSEYLARHASCTTIVVRQKEK
jgi:nucleotide-binding universal stress UspA family protein